MKFGDKLAQVSKGVYEDFYIDYGFLKDFVKDYSVDLILFRKAIDTELKKVNAFVCTMHTHPTFSKRSMLTYVLHNYIGIFKIFKKYDKLRSKNTKQVFYNMMSEQGFYQHYIKNTQRFNTDIRLVVFGYEGVIIQREYLFGNLVVELIRRLENVFPDICEPVDDCLSIWEYLGYDDTRKRISSNSIVVNGETDDIRNAICDYIINQRKLVICETESDIREIIKMVRQEWHELNTTKRNAKECGNTRAVFEFLKMNGIKIAVSTSCERKLVESTSACLNIVAKEPSVDKVNTKIPSVCTSLHRREPFKIDSLVCGNDMVSCRPMPDALLRICTKLKVAPDQAMIVGDTIADIHAGINARFSRTVGISREMSGLRNDKCATHIITSINGLPDLFLRLSENTH